MNRESVTVRPLHCVGCGAALPLGQGKTAVCRFCNAETPIPEEYFALQRAAKGFADNHLLAKQLYGKIGKPPGFFVRMVGRGAHGAGPVLYYAGVAFGALFMIHPAIGIAGLLVLAYGLGYPIAEIFRSIGEWTARPFGEKLSPVPVLVTAALSVGIFLGIPAILFAKEKALAPIRKDIHASLAAAPPERPGGPALCRVCGAALDVPKGALGVPCAYCKADNLVALPQAWVAHVKASDFHHFLRIDAALDAFHEASHEAKEQLFQLFLGIVASLVLMLVFSMVLQGLNIWY